MRADIFTKGFSDQAKWSHALSLINHVDARSFWSYDAKKAASYVTFADKDAPDAGGSPPAAGARMGVLRCGFAFFRSRRANRSDVIRRQHPCRQRRRTQPETWRHASHVQAEPKPFGACHSGGLVA
jgi:hypothetical protein